MKTLRNSLLIVLFLLMALCLVVFSGCNRKFIPVRDTFKDSVVTNTVIQYRSDTVKIPAQQIAFSKKIDRKKKIDTTIQKKNLLLHYYLYNDSLFVNCKTDSLLHIVDSLAQTITNERSFHNELKTIIQPVTEIKYRVPAWCFILIILVLLYFSLKIYFKLPI